MVNQKFHVQPRSKKDRSLPYTYEAWVDILEGRGKEPIYNHYFSDTLCGLVEVLAKEGFSPDHVIIKGLFRGKITELKIDLFKDNEDHWLKRPQLCHVLEEHYAHTHDECYKGHVEQGHCMFEDRDRQGVGPVW